MNPESSDTVTARIVTVWGTAATVWQQGPPSFLPSWWGPRELHVNWQALTLRAPDSELSLRATCILGPLVFALTWPSLLNITLVIRHWL